MRNLLQIFLRYGGFFLFVFLELLCLYLIIQYNQSQRAIYTSSVNAFTGFVDESVEDVLVHFTLSDIVDSLARENANYQELIFNEGLNLPAKIDSIRNGRQKYNIIQARVLKNTIKNHHNYILLDKGAADGVKEHSAVIDGDGIVGIVRQVRANYSIVMSMLHRQTRVSASLKNNNINGSLQWREGWSHELLDLDNIPKHIDVNIGDTVITSGFSHMFPEGIMIGSVVSHEIPEGSNFYDIQIRLNNDLSNLDYTYVVVNLDRDELLELERSMVDE